MTSPATPIYPSSAEKRKDDNTDRSASNSHAHILPAPSGGHGDLVKFQPIQKTTIVARPIAPAPLQAQHAQMASHTLARVGQAQPIGNVLPSSTLVATGAPSTLMASTGGSLTHSLTSGTSTTSTVTQPGMIQIASSIPTTPLNSMIRGATMQHGASQMQFPSHLPKGAAAAVSALTGPKSGQTVATAILRTGSQGASIQIPVSSSTVVPQTYHQHIQPRGNTLQGALATPVRPGTPPMTRAGSPVIAAHLQQQLDHSQTQNRSQTSSVQLTLPQRSTVDLSGKLVVQRGGTGELIGKQPARMLVDASAKIQQGKIETVAKLQTRTLEVASKQGQFSRSATDSGGKTPLQRSSADNISKLQQRTTMEASVKIPAQRPVVDASGKILQTKSAGDFIGKIQTPRTGADITGKQGSYTVPCEMRGNIQVQRAILDTTGAKLQSQKPSTVDVSNKMPLDGSGKLQLQRTGIDSGSSMAQVVRAPADSAEKIQIQRVVREPLGKMLHRPGPELQGKTLQSHVPHAQSKTVHVSQSYSSTPLPSKVVVSQGPVTVTTVPSHTGIQPTITSKQIKPGVIPLSGGSISSQLNTLSVPSLSTITANTGITSTGVSTSIPIAKVTPQRHHQPQLAPLSSTTTTAQGVVSMASGAGTVTVQDMHIAGQTQVGGMYMSPINRGTTGSAPIATPMTLPSQQTHTEPRPDRPGVPHMGQLLPEYYTYNMAPGPYQTMVYPNITTPQTLSQSSLRPRLITSPSPNLAASLQASIQGTAGSVTRLPHGIMQVDSSRPIPTHFASNTEGSALASDAVTITVSSGMPTYTLSPAGPTITSTQPSQNASGHSSSQSASPRPSILRKRASDGTPVKKPYCALNDNQTQSPRPESAPQSNNSSPKTPVTESRENSQSSTDTALSNEAAPLTSEVKVKQELPDSTDNGTATLNNMEASPRKKPRKQLLNAVEELKDATSSDDDLDRHMDLKEERRDSVKQEIKEDYYDDEGVRWTVEKTKPNISLMNFYNCSWKARNNHFIKYTDVKPKEERRPTVNELSNSKSVLQKATGWKLYYMAAQLEDLMDVEKQMCSSITEIQSSLSPHINSQNSEDVAAGRVHELTQGNIQRCQLVNDQLTEAKSSMLKILDHKKRILEIINKHMSKRPIKKKERS